jgi:hypothetical protein
MCSCSRISSTHLHFDNSFKRVYVSVQPNAVATLVSQSPEGCDIIVMFGGVGKKRRGIVYNLSIRKCIQSTNPLKS